MKNTNVASKLTAALAARNGVTPRTREEAYALALEVTGITSSDLGCDYCYDAECYLPHLARAARQNRKKRRIFSRFLFAFHSRKNSVKSEVARIIQRAIGGNGFRAPASALIPLLARARARPLTPQGRGYRSGIGIEIEGFSPVSKAALIDRLPLFATAVHDGSIRAPANAIPAEINAILDRDEMEVKLHKLCASLAKAGFGVNKSCGLHVHLDARHLSFEQVCAKAKVMDKWLSALRELVPASRHSNSYCEFGFSRHERYRAVNVTSHSKHSTLEVRLHSATISYQKVLSWVRLVELLMSLSKGPKSGLSCMATLETLPMADYERAYWRARHVQLNPSQYQGGANASTGGEE